MSVQMSSLNANERIKALLATERERIASIKEDLDCAETALAEIEMLVGDIERGRPLTRRERILASLAGETRSQSYLADDTGIPYSALVAELTLMVADELCEKVGKGAYRAKVTA